MMGRKGKVECHSQEKLKKQGIEEWVGQPERRMWVLSDQVSDKKGKPLVSQGNKKGKACLTADRRWGGLVEKDGKKEKISI